MTNSPIPTLRARDMLLRVRLTALALLIAAVFGGGAHAQVLVTDSAAISTTEEGFKSQLAQTVEQYTKQGMQYAKQIEQYQTQLEQLHNILTKIQDLGTGISLVPKNLEKLTEDQSNQLVDQACPGAPPGAVVSGVISNLLGSTKQPITVRQQLICRKIVLLQVDEYNIVAEALSQLNAQASTVQKLNDIVNSISTIGESNSATSQAQQYMAQLQTASDTWKKQIDADEAAIATLQQQQGVLAKVALNGSNTVLGHLVNAVALKAAFTIND
ncbi:hypothetical protein [Rhodanobacter caeni]|uniref:P-type DNA transfer protein VirB5 n=1 Tax=Rhodanobacter caeni TaxID=657654 RepID=A0ABN0ULE2_9GAMM